MKSLPCIENTVSAALEELGIAHERIKISPEFADTAVFCEKYGYPTDHCGNAIVVASKKEPKQFCTCIVKGSNRLDVNKTVRRLMEVRKASFATAKETITLTGMMIGGVTPFALPPEIPIFADHTILELQYIILGSGSRESKLKIHPEELKKIPNLVFIENLAITPQTQK